MTAWEKMAFAIDSLEDSVKIALVGKYTGLQDSYLSVIKALKHAAVAVAFECDHKLLFIL